MAVLSAFHLGSLARFGLQESQVRGEMLARALFHRARAVVETGGDAYRALGTDPGIRSVRSGSGCLPSSFARKCSA